MKQGSDKQRNSTIWATSLGVPTRLAAMPSISSASLLTITGFFATSVLIKPGQMALTNIVGPSSLAMPLGAWSHAHHADDE